METKNNGVHTVPRFMLENALLFLIQSIAVVMLYIIQFISWLVSGWILYAVAKGRIELNYTTIGLSYGLIAVLFAFLWLAVWKLNSKYGLKWFYSKIAFAEIPLLVALFFIKKTPDPSAMIPYQPEPLFSALVTAVILFPTYSILAEKYVLSGNKHIKRNFILIGVSMLLAGLAIFISSWNVMHLIYHF